MHSLDLDAIEARAAKALSIGVHPVSRRLFCQEMAETVIPALVARVRELEGEVLALKVECDQLWRCDRCGKYKATDAACAIYIDCTLCKECDDADLAEMAAKGHCLHEHLTTLRELAQSATGETLAELEAEVERLEGER